MVLPMTTFGRRWRARTGWTAAALALAAALIVPAPSALADAYGTGGADTGYLPDSADQTWCTYPSLVDAWYTPIKDSLNNLDSQTDMTDTYVSGCGPYTDAIFSLSNSSSMGAGVRGSTQCTAFTGGGRCETAQIKLNTQLLTDYTQRRKTACHELGHSVGLSHGSTYGGCMVSGVSSNSTYSSHHVSHINATF